MICAIPTFDVNQCSLRGQTFCFYLLRLGLAVTGAPAEHFGTRIHGGDCNNQLGQSPEAGWRKGRQSGRRVPEREAEWQEGAGNGGRVAEGCRKERLGVCRTPALINNNTGVNWTGCTKQ